MAVDSNEIKRALNSFEEDKFTDAKDILTKEIGKAKNDFLKDKLGLKDWNNTDKGEEE